MKATIIALLLTTATALADPPPKYPNTFLWGAAFSAHQTEGSLAGGGNNSDWHDFEHGRIGKKKNIKNGDTTDIAIDHWNRFAEDFQIAKNLGLQTLRTSVAWEKIEPQPGQFNSEVIRHYRDVLKEMHKHGIKPMIAFHHFVHPKWFHEQGGWTNPESPKWFLRYAEHVVRELGDLCDLWITFNEPVIQVGGGYMIGKIPPLVRNPWKAFDVAWNMARAHRMAAHMIHQIQGVPENAHDSQGRLRGVGIAYFTQIFDPADPNDRNDVLVANQVEELASWAFVRAVETGRLQLKFPKSLARAVIGDIDRPLPATDLPSNPGPMQDWLGINYYSRYLIKKSLISPLGVTWLVPKGVAGDNGWIIYPNGIERLLKKASEFKLPLVITENGLADAADSRRPQFIRDHLASLDRAIRAGADVRGYYFWSLLDNFEWLEGFEKRFGLVEIKYNDGLKRVPRASAATYKGEIELRK